MLLGIQASLVYLGSRGGAECTTTTNTSTTRPTTAYRRMGTCVEMKVEVEVEAEAEAEAEVD